MPWKLRTKRICQGLERPAREKSGFKAGLRQRENFDLERG
jgi:hypothetical protein